MFSLLFFIPRVWQINKEILIIKNIKTTVSWLLQVIQSIVTQSLIRTLQHTQTDHREVVNQQLINVEAQMWCDSSDKHLPLQLGNYILFANWSQQGEIC